MLGTLIGLIAWSAAMALAGAGLAVFLLRRRAGGSGELGELASFFEHAPVPLGILNREGTVKRGNETSARAYGLDLDSFLKTPAADLLAFWPEAETFWQRGEAVLLTGEAQRFNAPFRIPGTGEERIYDVMLFPIRDERGVVVHVGNIAIDITAQSKAEAALAEREAQLSSLFQHVPADIAVFDRNHRAVMVNHTTSKAYDRESLDFVGTHPSEFRQYWPEFDKVMGLGVSVLQTGESKRFRTSYNPPGKTRQVQFDGIFFPIRAKSGEVDQVGLFLLDVTEQRQAQAELAEQQANLLAFFDYAPLQVYVTDLDHKIVMVNDWVFRETGARVFHPSNVIGLSADQMVPTQWADLSHDNDAKVVGRGDVTQVEVRGQFGGKERDIISIRFPIKNAGGEVVRIGGFVVDVTKQKEAERALQERLALSHQSEKLAALGQLLAGVAHELNNPLTVVVGRSAILAEKLVGTPYEKAILGLREAADRCNRIVKTFLAMARQSAPRRGPVQLAGVVEAALDITAYGMRASGIRIEVDLGAGLPDVDADEDQLVQVFTNLLLNAQHALEAHDGERVIRVSVGATDAWLKVVVADSGPGVPAELQSRIFEPFFTTKEVGQGTGMGLAMSRGIIEEHGGALGYGRSPDGGASFEISLPIALTAAPAAPSAEPERVAAARGRALIIDDEEPIRAMLVEILQGIGLECAEAANGAEALTRLEHESFDAVICDVRMPEMDGIRFRQECALRRPELLDRLVFISGDVLQRERDRFAEISDHPFIEKPFDPPEVRRIALEVLSRATGQPVGHRRN